MLGRWTVSRELHFAFFVFFSAAVMLRSHSQSYHSLSLETVCPKGLSLAFYVLQHSNY